MRVSEKVAPPVRGMGGSLHGWVRSVDPWHNDAFRGTPAEGMGHAGKRKVGWDGLDGFGNVICFVPDGTVIDDEVEKK